MRCPWWVCQAGWSPDAMFSIRAVKNWLFVHLQFIVLSDAFLSPANQENRQILTLFSSHSRPSFSLTDLPSAQMMQGMTAMSCPTRHMSVFADPHCKSQIRNEKKKKKITHLTACWGVVMPLYLNREEIMFPASARDNFLIYPHHITSQHMGLELFCSSIDTYTGPCVYMDRESQLITTKTQRFYSRGDFSRKTK